MKKLLYLMAFLSACSSSKIANSDQSNSGRNQTKQRSEAPMPAWVSKRPISTAYYIGIGVASKDVIGNSHLEESRKRALGDLVGQISVNVATNSVLDRIEQGGDISSDYRSITQTTSNIKLEDYETVDTWEGPSDYWIYLRISKTRYAELRAQAQAQAVSKAVDFYDKALKAEEAGMVTVAVDNACSALESIKEYLNESLQTEFAGKSIFLGNEIVSLLNRVFKNLVLTYNIDQLDLKAGRPVEQETILSVRYRSGRAFPVRNLPLNVAFTKGDGDITGNPVTNDRGQYLFKIGAVSTRESTQEITISPDLDAIFQGRNKQVWRKLLNKQSVPEASLVLNVKPPVFFIRSKEKNIGQDVSGAPLARAVRERLFRESFQLSEAPASADYIVEIIADTKEDQAAQGLAAAQMTMRVTVTDLESGKLVFDRTWNNLRASQNTVELAGMLTFQRAARELQLTAVPNILKQILNL